MVGSGRTEILRSIFGLDKIIDGKIDFFDQKINPNKPEDAIKQGIVMIPEDRRKQGLGRVFSTNKYIFWFINLILINFINL